MVKHLSGFLLPFTLLLLCLSCSNTLSPESSQENEPSTEGRYDLNVISYEELISLDGIKKNVAREIISFRQNIQFKRLEDLLAVKGIGEKTFYRIKDYFYISR